MNRRDFVKMAAAMPLAVSFGGCMGAAGGSGAASAAVGFETAGTAVGGKGVGSPRIAYDGKGGVKVEGLGLKRPVRMVFAGDTHLAFHDSRDDAYAGNYARMAKYAPKKEHFEQMLASLSQAKPDALVLLGDNISFPTLANVEYLKGELDKSGLDYLYIAGNHDWHFEGDTGSDFGQRSRWIEKRLKGLYRGNNPLMYSRLIGGVRIVMIDNSAYHVTPEQLAFWRAEAAKGDPMILAMHIPFWQPGYSVTTCACPDWGAATDPYWEIERRERWSEKLMPSTYEFKDAVYSAPNLVAVVAGHVHRFECSRERGQLQLTAPSNSKGANLDFTLA